MLIRELTKDLYAINATDIDRNGATANDVQQLAACFDRCGCLVIEDVYSTAFIDGLKRGFDERYGKLSETDMAGKYYEVGDKRYQVSLEITAPFNDPEIFSNRHVCGVNRILLGDRFLLDSCVAVLSLGGAPAQHMHRDCPPLFEDWGLSGRLPTYALTVVIPLVDIDLRCGSTALWPGTHKAFSTEPVSDEPGLPVVKRGSVYLWDYRLLHAGGANLTQAERPILALVYTRPWFSDATNFHKEPPVYLCRAEYEKLPEATKPLFSRFLWQLA